MCGGRCLDFMNRRDPGSRELTGVIQVKFQELWENNWCCPETCFTVTSA